MIGTPLGPYRIERELGSGGMGKVYAATVEGRCPGLDEGTLVALKVVHPHLLETPGFFKRFLREAEIGQAVVHENVVRTFDCDQIIADGVNSSFLSMEYVEGQTLRELQDELEIIPEELCRHVGREIAKGLSAIHAAGVIHRDMKPENVLITADHVVKVMDLGVARLAEEAIRLSRTGVFVGSVLYSAPEQFTGGDIDGRADLFALGVLLYELASGAHPHPGNDFGAVLARVIESEPRRVGDRNPQLSPFFEEVVHCLLAKAPGDRFATAEKLLAVLTDGEDSAWWHQRAHALQAKTRRPLRRIRIPRETAVYGREHELELLRGLYEQAKAADGQVVLLSGEAGIGKSRLVDELVARLQRDGEDLNFLFGSYPPNGAATASGAFSFAYRNQFGEEGAADYLPQNPLLVPAFDALLKGDIAPSGTEPLTKDSLQTCFVNATRALAAKRVTLVLIDDLHFGPEEARALFTSLAMAVPEHRVLLIGTTRPGATDGWQGGLDRFEHVTRLAPPRLSAKDLGRLLEDAFQSDELAESLGYRIMVKSDGNPFFAFEIIRGLREGQFITQKGDGTWVTTNEIEEIEIPSSVLDLVNARVARLTEDERALLDVAACWGHEFDPGLIGDVLGMARIPTLRALGQIERQHRLVRASGRTMVFDHHQVQEALYGSLLEQLREEYHAALAEALETQSGALDKAPEALDGALSVDLCEHFLKGARGASALRYLEAARAHLTTGYLHAQVVELTELALAIPDLLTGTERALALLDLAGALDLMGHRERQEECAREAERLAEEAEDEEVRGQAAQALGNVCSRGSRNDEAEAAYRRAIDIAATRGDRKAEATAMGSLGHIFWALGRLPEAQEHYERQLVFSREIGDRKGEASAMGSLGGVFLVEGNLPAAQDQYERSLAIYRAIGDRQGEASSTGNLGGFLYSQGRLSEALPHFERKLLISREIAYRRGEAIARGNLGAVFKSEGRLREAREHTERYLALSREIGHRKGEAFAIGNLGGICSDEGRQSEAREYYKRHLELSREIGDPQSEGVALHNQAVALSEEGEPARAKERLLAALRLSEEIGYQYLTAATHLRLGSLYADADDDDFARKSLTTGRDLAAAAGYPGLLTLSRCLLACLPGGSAEDAKAAFAENDERLEAVERREAHWLLFRATGDRVHLEEARRLLDEAAAHVDDEARESIFTNIRLNREIVAACGEAGR